MLFAGPFLGLVSATILESVVLSSAYERLSYLNPIYWMYLSTEAKSSNLHQLLPDALVGSDGFRITEHLPWASSILKIGSSAADGYVAFTFYKSLLEKISPELGNSIIDYAPLLVYLGGNMAYLAGSFLPHTLASLSVSLYVLFLIPALSSFLYKAYTNLPDDAFEKLKDLPYDLGPYLLAFLTSLALNYSNLLSFKITWPEDDRSASFFSGVLSR